MYRESQQKFRRRTLIDEIKSILHQYPDDGQIFKEIIQNAEDAGASEVVFIHDKTDERYKNYQYSNEKLKKYQVPSLYSYNDSHFTNEDWEGIISLGISGKTQDPLKVGRFGLGFKSVFHLTDLPCVASGSTFAYLDPLKETFPEEVCTLDLDKPIETSKSFQDFAAFKRLGANNGGKFWDSNNFVNGTLFRLPLRLERSEISSMIYDNQKISMLLKKFMKEAHMTLLFLKHVRSIKVCTIEEGKLTEVYCADLTEDCKQYTQIKANFIRDIDQLVSKKNFKTIKHLNHILEIKVKHAGEESCIYKYAVSERYGYTGRNEEFLDLMCDDELFYIPLVSVAHPLTENDPGGHLYCALPLPLLASKMTGLPVHVNGFFALGQDRKDLKWKTMSTAESNDKSVNWNIYLIKELLPLVYVNLFKFLIESKHHHQLVYRAWPNIKEADSKWQDFVKRFHEKMIDCAFIYVEFKQIWVPINSVFLISDDHLTDKQKTSVQEFLTKCEVNHTIVPRRLSEDINSRCHWINKDVINSNIRTKPNVYSALCKESQCQLLSFSVNSKNDLEYLINQRLFPLCSGNYFQLNQRGWQHYFLPIEDHIENIFPTTDMIMDKSFFETNKDFLNRIIEILNGGHFNINVLNDWKNVISATKESLPTSWNTKEMIPWPDNTIKADWCQNMRCYQRKWNIPAAQFDGFPLIEVENGKNKFLWKVSRNSSKKPLLETVPSSISDDMRDLLLKLGVFFVCKSVPSDISSLLAYDNFVNKPVHSSIIWYLQNAGESQVLRIFPKNNKQLIEEVILIIVSNRQNLPEFFRRLPLFECVGNRAYVPANSCVSVSVNDIPKDWNPAMGNLLPLNKYFSIDNLASTLTVKRWTYTDICRTMFQNFYRLSENQQLSFSNEVLQRIQSNINPQELINLFKAHGVILDDAGQLKKPSSLFRHQTKLEILFQGESSKFPHESYHANSLLLVGLKELSQVTSIDVQQSIQYVSQQEDTLSYMDKVKAILEIIALNNLSGNFNSCSWIPVASTSPKGYPDSLTWYGNNPKPSLEKPCNIYSESAQWLVGSLGYIIHPQLASMFVYCFHAKKNVFNYIQFGSVRKHLKNMEECYASDERVHYEKMAVQLYEFLSQYPNEILRNIPQEGFQIWHGDGFVPYNQIVICNEISRDLTPYIYKPPDCVAEKLEHVLNKLGCIKRKFEVYINVLRDMSKRNDQRVEGDLNDMKDTNLALSLVVELAEKYPQECQQIRSQMFVPIDSPKLQLHSLESCFYLEVDKQAAFETSRSTNSILHRNLTKDVAKQLNVQHLARRVLTGNRSNIFTPWGQKQEPLTRHLKKILSDYEDGLAIIKELLQNADDAGATEVSFLYDQRNNDQYQSKLIDPGMKNWQGPALWVYNNQVFTEKDFENITKLNAGTKEFQTTKIGKFGLGFNSVYHLTDVPSILSDDSLVIFDPHFKYLGGALNKSEPGIRISLHENVGDLNNFCDQFAVFEGIFGANINLDPNKKSQSYPATLFRFPLRNAICAKQSEIKQFEYTSGEMKKLLQKFEDSGETLLLFTQNVQKVNVHILKDTALSIKEQELMFSIQRQQKGFVHRMVEFANAELENMVTSWRHLLSNKSQTDSVRILSKKSNETAETSWLICSQNASLSTYKFAINNKGRLPYVSVAIKVNKDEPNILPLKDGLLFSFLPLPIPSSLPIHVNASFEIDNSRRSLRSHTQDEKNYGMISNWNDLLADDVGCAFFSLLLHIKKRFNLSHYFDFYDYFPDYLRIENDRFAMKVTYKLLMTCLQSENSIFPCEVEGEIKWKNWHQLCVLSADDVPKSMRTDSVILMNWFLCKENKDSVCVDLPEGFLKLANKFLKEKIDQLKIGWGHIIKLFKISLNQHQSGFDIEIRNRFINFLIKKRCLESYGFEDCPCIPTHPNGRLRKISELILKESKVSILYNESDEVFPNVENESMRYLSSLGMHSDSLSWKMIVDRARKIEATCNDEKSRSIKQSAFLLKLIEKKIESGEEESCDEELKMQLIQIEFLPVMQKPENSVFPDWFGSSKVFGAPCNMFEKRFHDIVCCSQIICDDLLSDEMCRFLQLKTKPTTNDVILQLENLVQNFEKDEKKFFPPLDALYQYISTNGCDDILQKKLKEIPFVRTSSNQLVKASLVFVDIKFTLTNHLFKLHGPLKDDNQIRDVLIEIGVKSEANGSDYVNAFVELHSRFGTKQLDDNIVKEICQIVPFLCDLKDLDENKSRLYIPDLDKRLRLINELCYNDTDWLPVDPKTCYVHPDISKKHAVTLGIRSRRNEAFMRDCTPIEEFGQHEDIANRIKNILKGYSDPEDVFKEMFQNADDAGATEIKFILDKRSHGTEKVLNEQWKSLQGPALLICNDGKFTENDVKGIQSIGLGSKTNDPFKTGKYGIGFNSVYGITDCPMLFSCVQNDEHQSDDVLCLFDPSLAFVDVATKHRPGGIFRDAKAKLKPYDDMRDALLWNRDDLEGKTLFRLPIRNKETCAESKISQEPVTQESVEKSIKKVISKAETFLLFLKNIKKVSFEIIADKTTTKERFEVFTFDTNRKKLDEYRHYEKSFPERFGNLNDILDSSKVIYRNNCIQRFRDDKITKKSHWYVVEQIGFSNTEDMDEEIQKALEANECQLIPKGGLAKKMTDDSCDKCCSYVIPPPITIQDYRQQSSLFCTLPIPVSTGISGIINGNFILDYETRRNLFNSEMLSVKSKWNFAILKHCVLPCFVNHLEKSKASFEGSYNLEEGKESGKEDVISHFYSQFPDFSKAADPYFKKFAEWFYQFIYEEKKALLCVHKNLDKRGDVSFYAPDQFLQYKNSPIPDSRTHISPKCDLLTVLKLVDIETDIVPENIANNFNKADKPLAKVSPIKVQEKLKSLAKTILKKSFQKPIDKTSIRDRRNAGVLLRYCLKKENQEKEKKDEGSKNEISLDGLPLCVLQDDSLRCFSSTNTVFCTEYSTMLENCHSLCLHKDLVKDINNAETKYQRNCFKEFGLNQFLIHLKNSRYYDVVAENRHPFEIPQEITKSWLKEVWSFIYSLKCKCAEEEKRVQEEKRKRNGENVQDKEEKASEQNKWGFLTQLDDCSLVVADNCGKSFLLPVRERKSVLVSPASGRELLKTLIKDFNIFIASSYFVVNPKYKYAVVDVYPKKLYEDVFGSFDKFEDVVDAVWYANAHKPIEMNEEKVERLLLHLRGLLNGDVRVEYKDKLRSLPLFQDFNGRFRKTKTRTIILPSGIPNSNDMATVQEENNVIVLKLSEKDKELFKLLGFEMPTWIEFYLKMLIPVFQHLERAAIIKHLSGLKSVLEYQTKDQNLIHELSITKFLPNCNDERRYCHEFYDRNVPIFNLMQAETDFPSKEFSPFTPSLIEFGLVSKLNYHLFKTYAMALENENDIEKFEKASRNLCEELQTNEELQKELLSNDGFINSLKTIRFILPHKIDNKLEEIHPSLNSKVSRISYNGSIISKHSELGWINSYVLPEYSYSFDKKRETDNWKGLKEKLGILTKESIKFQSVKEVISTITNLEHCLEPTNSRSCKRIKEGFAETFINIMVMVYEYFLTNKSTSASPGTSEELFISMHGICFILVNDKAGKLDHLSVPCRSILKGNSKLFPYLNSMATEHGQYFEVLQKFGCSKHLFSKHYLSVLKEINDVSRGQKLDPNIGNIAKKSTKFLAENIRSNPIECEEILYLPTVTFHDPKSTHMRKSSECVIVDDVSKESRLKELSKPLLFHDNGKNRIMQDSFMKHLPENIRPQILSKFVEEKLVLDQNEVKAENTLSKLLKDRIKHENFLDGLKRLIAHDSGEESLAFIEDLLKDVKVFCLKDVRTELSYSGDVIPHSQASVSVYTSFKHGQLHVYIKESAKDQTSLFAKVSKGLQSLLQDRLTNPDSIIALSHLLNKKSNEIKGFLDEMEIKDNFGESTFIDSGKSPKLGQPIPLDLHSLLRPDFARLEIDEYVGFDEDGEGKYFVYARIKTITEDFENKNCDQTFGIQINDDDEDILQVPAYKIYKFDQSYERSIDKEEEEDESTNDKLEIKCVLLLEDDFSEECKEKDYEEIIEELRNIFIGLKSKEKTERKTIIRRLYLTWHPDKHSNKTLATKVFQFIQNEIRKLDGGFTEEDAFTWNEQASQSRSSYEEYTSRFRNFFSGQDRSSYGRPGSGESHGGGARTRRNYQKSHVPPSFNQTNPQPAEAKRWFKQAQHDLETTKCLNRSTTSNYEWCCYISYQAAEKALKGAIYSQDFKNINKICNLVTLAKELTDEIQGLALELQTLVKNEDAPRYPSYWLHPSIPNDHFKQSDAENSVNIATQIIDTVQLHYFE